MAPASEAVLTIHNFSIFYPGGKKSFFSRERFIPAVVNFNLRLKEGSITGLVGESGCGKSSLGRALVGLVPYIQGECLFRGKPFDPRHSRDIRKKIQIIFQDPYGSLNPRQTIGEALKEIEEVLIGPSGRDTVQELLEAVQLPQSTYHRYPHELSGGQRQRACIARALAVNPQVLICDEIVSSLDVSLQAKIINLLLDLRETRGLTLLFTTHNLKLARVFCDHLVVMYRGRNVEQGPVKDVFSTPAHPYTIDLLSVAENLSEGREMTLDESGRSSEAEKGCVYHRQCSLWNGPERQESWQCSSIEPAIVRISDTHCVYCKAVYGD